MFRYSPCSPCCGSGSCSTSINLNLVNFDGTAQFCTPPGEIDWQIQGKTTGGATIGLSGVASLAAPTFRLSLLFSGTQLPAGQYSFSFTERAAICGQSVGDNHRFAPTSFPLTVVCPTTTANFTATAAFDLQNVAGLFGLRQCTNLPPNTDASVSVTAGGPATVCSESVPAYSNGINAFALTATFKVTGYPFTATFTCSGSGVLTGTEVQTYTACNTVTTDWQGANPYACGIAYGIRAQGCGGAGLPGANFAFSGGITGQGVTGPSGTGFATLTNYTVQQTGGDPPLAQATVSRDRFVTQTHTEVASTQFLAFGCIGLVALIPDDSHACGGCPVPFAKQGLVGSAFGQTIPLTWTAGQNGNLGQWVGTSTLSMPALSCPDPNTGKTTIATGNVPILMNFNAPGFLTQGALASPGLTVYYRGNGNCEPTTCGGQWCPFPTGGGGGAPRVTASCSPFLGTVDGKSGLAFGDGYAYNYTVHWTVSE